LGHHVGLEVHDVEDPGSNLLFGMKAKSWLINYHEMLKDPSAAVSVLSPGMVITIEPGMQVPPYIIILDFQFRN
jgi:Xaa-Pro aminopeptidase